MSKSIELYRAEEGKKIQARWIKHYLEPYFICPKPFISDRGVGNHEMYYVTYDKLVKEEFSKAEVIQQFHEHNQRDGKELPFRIEDPDKKEKQESGATVLMSSSNNPDKSSGAGSSK